MPAWLESVARLNLKPFHATYSEIEIVTGDGKIRLCSEREDQHPELFLGAAGSCGTIGVIILIKVQLMPAKPYVQVTLCHADSAAEIHERTLKAMEDSAQIPWTISKRFSSRQTKACS